jgi:arylsulfatase A-like enzyme
VPLVFSGPGIPRGKSSDAFAYLFDAYPTICELVGAPLPAPLDGKSLAPIIQGKAEAVRDTIFLAYRGVQRAVRRGRWKLIRYPEVDRTQLFDLEADPSETKDVSGDPEQRGRVRELLALLAEEQKRFGDAQPLTADRPRPGDVDAAFFKAALEATRAKAR